MWPFYVSMCSRNLGCSAGHVSVCVSGCCSAISRRNGETVVRCFEVAVEPGSSLSDDGESQKTTYPLTEAETGPPSTRPAPLSLSLCSSSHARSRVIAFFGGRRWNVARCKNCGSLLLMAALSYLNAGEEMKLIGSQSNGDVVDLQAAWV